MNNEKVLLLDEILRENNIELVDKEKLKDTFKKMWHIAYAHGWHDALEENPDKKYNMYANLWMEDPDTQLRLAFESYRALGGTGEPSREWLKRWFASEKP